MEAATRPGAGEELTAYRKKVQSLERLERKLNRLSTAEERDEGKISETEKKIARAEVALSKMEKGLKNEIDRLSGEWRKANATEAARAMVCGKHYIFLSSLFSIFHILLSHTKRG